MQTESTLNVSTLLLYIYRKIKAITLATYPRKNDLNTYLRTVSLSRDSI